MLTTPPATTSGTVWLSGSTLFASLQDGPNELLGHVLGQSVTAIVDISSATQLDRRLVLIDVIAARLANGQMPVELDSALSRELVLEIQIEEVEQLPTGYVGSIAAHDLCPGVPVSKTPPRTSTVWVQYRRIAGLRLLRCRAGQ
jgi:hypothetical protein